MSGLFGILHVARTAILAQQTAVRVTSQNIANAETEGYTRQRADLVATPTIMTPMGALGTGVRVRDVTRLRDPLLDANYRRDSGRAAGADLQGQLLGQIEAVLNEPSTTGLSAALDAFHASWGDLSNQPTSAPIRGLVVQRGAQLATMFRSFSARLDDTLGYAEDRLTAAVNDVNRYSGQIATVTTEIIRIEAGGLTAGDLRDQRDLLIDKMSALGSVRVVDREGGDVAVFIDGAMVVEAGDSHDLSVAGSPTEVRIGSRALNFEPGTSTIGNLLEVINTQLPAIQARLDELAGGIVEQVNAIHSSGYTTGGATGVDFFDAAGTTARTIAMSATASTVVSTDTSGQSGNNRIALAMAALRDAPAKNTIAAGIAGWAAVSGNLGGLSFAEHYHSTVADLGTAVNDATNAHTVNSALAQQSEMRRASISGVSTDEELIRVMQHQQSYAAAARVVSVVDEMMQTILQLT